MGDEYWPVHFNFWGQANGWEHAGGIPSLIIIQVFLFVAFFLMDEGLLELGRWDFAAPMASFISVLLFCCLLNYHWARTPESAPSLPVSFPAWLWAAALAAAFAALALNFLRRLPAPVGKEIIPPLPATMAKSSWVYWEHVKAKWMDVSLALLLFMLAMFLFKTPRIVGLRLALELPIWLLCLLLIGGFHYSITRERIELRWGWARIRLLNLRITEVTEVEVMTSGVFRRFGGFGIRYGAMAGWGFVIRNNGVSLKTRNGRSFTFSAKNPAMTAELIKNAMSRHAENRSTDN
jgi:hypothetical protein